MLVSNYEKRQRPFRIKVGTFKCMPSAHGFDWQPYTSEDGAIMVFNEECSLRHDFDRGVQTILQGR